MNLIEAVKTGKPFKRKFWSSWITSQSHDGCKHDKKCDPCLRFDGDIDPKFTELDIIADDYIVDNICYNCHGTGKV